MSDTTSTFSTTNNSFTTKSFLESNSLIAKFAFLLLVVFIFVIILRLFITILPKLLTRNRSPRLLTGMVSAKELIVFPQDPSDRDAVTIYRSMDAKNGIEFTWSVWLYIDNLQYLEGKFKHVFHKGNSNTKPNGLNYPNNAPGLYLAPYKNNLLVLMNTFNNIEEEIAINDIPIRKWVNVIIRCRNTVLDVYINGTIKRSVTLNGIPRQNFGEVYVGMNGGFDGDISNLWYYNYAIGTGEIQKIVGKGPNTKVIGNIDKNNSSDYLSLRWYFSGNKDLYNP